MEIFASNVVGDDPLGSFRRHALAVRHAFGNRERSSGFATTRIVTSWPLS